MRKTSTPKSDCPSQSQAPEMDWEADWQKQMRSVLDTKAAGPNQNTAMLPITWKSGWTPATVKALLQEAVAKTVSGKVPLLQFSERVMAFKCFMFVYIWTTQRAVLYGSHREELYRARFTEKSMNSLKQSATFAELNKAIDGLVEEKL
ncbi:hypothetical protein PG991_001601 [Apiospora marii]|uniref:Uncharacterized protein n=1 Tax=Apiospora marii TaxID=335849 RepID=A0ABR1SQ47_9PEZI